jgi:uncharacterized protein
VNTVRAIHMTTSARGGLSAEAMPAAGEPGPRLAILDLLRGSALFGMILVHFHQGFRLSTPYIDLWPGESLSEWVLWIAIEQKAAAIFALLFGVGFAMLLRRAAARGRSIGAYYVRRLAALALIGVAVEALTGYAILIHLAMWGMPLLLVRHWSTRSLLVLAIASAVALPVYHLGLGVHEVLAGSAAQGPAPAGFAEPRTYAEEVGRRLFAMQGHYLRWRTLIPNSTFVLFLIGMIALRRGVFDEPLRHLRLIGGAMAFGLASWIAYWLILPLQPAGWTSWSSHAWPIRYGLGIVSDHWLAFTYAGGLVLLCAQRPLLLGRLAAFGSVGRAALTCYVLQASVIYWMRSDFGLGLHLRPSYRVAAAALLFTALVIGGRAWLARFRYGPLEWAWRAASRLSLPATREAGPVPVTGEAGRHTWLSERARAPAPWPEG